MACGQVPGPDAVWSHHSEVLGLYPSVVMLLLVLTFSASLKKAASDSVFSEIGLLLGECSLSPSLPYLVNNYSLRDSRAEWVADASKDGTLVVGPK